MKAAFHVSYIIGFLSLSNPARVVLCATNKCSLLEDQILLYTLLVLQTKLVVP